MPLQESCYDRNDDRIGFAKKDDLKYILELLGIEYVHSLDLAPTEGMMKAIKQREISWTEFESAFIDLLAARKVESGMAAWLGEGAIPCFSVQR